MKKKLFIRDLQKRKSSSTLLTSVPSKLQPIGTSCFTRPADQQSQPTYSTQAIGEEGSSVNPEDKVIARYAVPEPIKATTLAIGEEGNSVNPEDKVIARYAVPEPIKATTLALGEEGFSPSPIDGPVAMYGVPDPNPIVSNIQEEGGISPIDPIIVKYGPPTPIPIEPRPVDPILVKYGPPTPIPIEPRPVDPILVKYGPPTPAPVTTQALGEEGSTPRPHSPFSRVITVLQRRLELFKQRFGDDSIRVRRTQDLIDKFQRRISNTRHTR